MKNNYILLASCAIVALIIGFVGGMKFQQGRFLVTGRFGNGQLTMRNGNGQPRNGNAFRPVSGEVISGDDKSLSVKLADGSSKLVLFGKNVVVAKATEGSVSDLASGVKVMVYGTANNDGSVTASMIQINPIIPSTASSK